MIQASQFSWHQLAQWHLFAVLCSCLRFRHTKRAGRCKEQGFCFEQQSAPWWVFMLLQLPANVIWWPRDSRLPKAGFKLGSPWVIDCTADLWLQLDKNCPDKEEAGGILFSMSICTSWKLLGSKVSIGDRGRCWDIDFKFGWSHHGHVTNFKAAAWGFWPDQCPSNPYYPLRLC